MTIKDLVYEALDNALDNGYDFQGMSHLEIAEDMVEFDAQLENEDPQDLVPHVQSWWSAV